ncbi:MAG: glycosyltransferase [Candidatus Nanoarchaeia archaeon]
MNLIYSLLLWTAYLISLYTVVFWTLVYLDKMEGKPKRIKLKKLPFVTIAIPVWNEEKSVIGTIESVLALEYPKNKLDIIIVNDGSTDGTRGLVEEFLKGKDLPIKLINQKNEGKGAALNVALKHSKGEFFACLDADSFVHNLTLRKMLYQFERGSDDLAIVTPIMKIAPPKTIWQRLQRIEYIVGMFLSKLMSSIDCLYVAPGPFSLYRISSIHKLGGFKNHITEDQEIAYRAQQANMAIKQCPDGFVYTLGPKTWKTLYAQRNRWFKGGLDCTVQYRRLLLNKNYGDFGMLQMSVNVLMFFLAMVTMFFSFYYLVWPLIKGVYDLWLVGFDIMPYLHTIELSFNFLVVDLEKLFILFTTFGFTLLLFFVAHSNVNEKVRQHGTWTILPYFFVYYIVLSLIALVVVAEYGLGRQQRW